MKIKSRSVIFTDHQSSASEREGMGKAVEHPRNCSLTGTCGRAKPFFTRIMGPRSRLAAVPALLMLLLGLTPVPPGPTGLQLSGGALAAEAPAAADDAVDDEDDDEDDLERDDDGSGRLNDLVETFKLDALVPVPTDEEEALLGNWGDADSEDED